LIVQKYTFPSDIINKNKRKKIIFFVLPIEIKYKLSYILIEF